MNVLSIANQTTQLIKPLETLMIKKFTAQIVENTLPQSTFNDLILPLCQVQLANQGELREKLKLSAHDYAYFFSIPYSNILSPNNRNIITAGDYILRTSKQNNELIIIETPCYIIKDIAVTSVGMTLYAIESAQIPGKTEIMDGNNINPLIELS